MDKVYEVEGGIVAPLGFKVAGYGCGIKKNAKDLALIYSIDPCVAAGVFTQNEVKAAPVVLSELHVKDGSIQAVIANSGNANAYTGAAGHVNAAEMARLTAKELDISSDMVLVASTGIIGEKLPIERIKSGIKVIAKLLGDGPESNEDAASAIMTTDTVAKSCAFEFETPEGFVKVGGIAKGSGMIAPNMATMLAFLTTDAKVSAPILSKVFKLAVDESFNSITIDSMSTNDMAVILANGMSGIEIESSGPRFEEFREAVRRVCITLATAMIKDAEGATKLIEVIVSGTQTSDDAKKVARAIAQSNLVKTAMYGSDPNWGRIIAAAGSVNVNINPNTLDLSINGAKILEQGQKVDFDDESIKALMDLPEIQIKLECDVGQGTAKILTSDLTEEYVKINAHYKT